MKRIVIFSVVFLLLVGLVGGFAYFQFVTKPKMIQEFMSAGGMPSATISAAEAQADAWVPIQPAIGTLRAVQGIDVAPQLGGVIRALHFDSGETVTVGTLLVELDDEVEQADLKSGLAALNEANLTLGRQQELFERGNTSAASLDASIASRDTAAATVERARALIDQKSIEAPFSGLLGIRLVDVGQYVSPGTPLVTLQQQAPIYADFPIPEQSIATIAVGQTIEVRVDAFPGEMFTGEIESIDAKVEQETRDVLVRAVLPNVDQKLLPGMFANVAVLAGDPVDVVTIPRTAVSYSLYGDSIYVIVVPEGAAKPNLTPDETSMEQTEAIETAEGETAVAGDVPITDEAPAEAASETTSDDASATDAAATDAAPPLVVERRFIRVGETRGNLASIAEGLAPGEIVVTSGQLKLFPGAPVVIDNSIALDPPAVRPNE
ncbi:MAG: efflux RND transporter periplasmic adaptor subunit [Dongiaceae bacterium]